MTLRSGPAMKSFSQSEIDLQKIEAEMAWIRENDKGQTYVPNSKVEEFVRKVAESEGQIVAISAANAVGKTVGLVMLGRTLVFGPPNRWFDYELFRNWPYEKRIRIVSEPSQIKESGPIPSEIRKWWPKGAYQEFKGGYSYTSEYRAKGWIVEIMTYEQDRKQHEGSNLGMVMFNEPPPKHLWTPNLSRLRGKGKAVVAMTPLTEAGWFFDEVAPKIGDSLIYADVESACKEHGVRGHLEHKQIETMIDGYDAEEREARIEGKAMYLKGLIFKDFDPRVHILKTPVQVEPGHSLYHVVDPHTDKPFAMIWAGVDSRGNITIVDEWPNVDFYKWRNCNLSIPDYKSIFYQKENGFPVTKRIIDRHFAEVTHLAGMTRRTLRDDFQEQGIDFEPSYQAREEIDAGVHKVREYLRYNQDRPIDTLNTPRLFINPHCFNTIKSLTRWSMDPETGKYKDEFKDFCDVVRYLVMANPEVEEPSPRFEPRKLWG